MTKMCDSIEPIPPGWPANFKVEFENTGNVDLEITADDGIGTFSLAVEETKNFTVTIDGPFSGPTGPVQQRRTLHPIGLAVKEQRKVNSGLT